MRCASSIHALRQRAIGLSRLWAARKLHVPSEAAFAALKANVHGAIRYNEGSDASRADAARVSIIASRAVHAPVLRLEQTEGSRSDLETPLSITSDSLPPEAQKWLAGSRGAVEGMWSAWRQNDWLRLHATVADHNDTTAISDLKVVADDFALYRQDALKQLAEKAQRHPLERKAGLAGLFYHKRQGDEGGRIGSLGYGAGVAMSTMDALAVAGGRPANFLDGGGGATEANVRAGLDVLLRDPDVKVIFVNSFGGLTKTDMIAQGIVEVLRETVRSGRGHPPFVVRLRGTGEAEAKRILEDAKDLERVQVEPSLNKAAQLAVDLSKDEAGPNTPLRSQPVHLSPVVFSKEGQYESTRDNLSLEQGARVLVMGTGKASLFHNGVAQKYGTNIVGACAPGKEGTTFLDKPVFGTLRKAISALQPRVASVFVPYTVAADAIIDCIEGEIPLVVAYAEGIPQKDQLRVQAALRSQSRTRLMGANCPGMILPGAKVKLGIQPLAVHSPGSVGLASRSGTISYELASQTTELGLGQSAVFGLGGDPFPGTRTWEVLDLMLRDDKTKVICLVGEVGGQMEEEAAEVYKEYRAKLSRGKTAKPVVGFIAGASTTRGLVYGHAGAVWWTDAESAESKKRYWRDAGIIVAPTLGEVGAYIKTEATRLGIL